MHTAPHDRRSGQGGSYRPTQNYRSVRPRRKLSRHYYRPSSASSEVHYSSSRGGLQVPLGHWGPGRTMAHELSTPAESIDSTLDARSFSMTDRQFLPPQSLSCHRSLTSLRSQATAHAGHRYAPTYPQQMRLRAPGQRPPSPAQSEMTGRRWTRPQKPGLGSARPRMIMTRPQDTSSSSEACPSSPPTPRDNSPILITGKDDLTQNITLQSACSDLCGHPNVPGTLQSRHHAEGCIPNGAALSSNFCSDLTAGQMTTIVISNGYVAELPGNQIFELSADPKTPSNGPEETSGDFRIVTDGASIIVKRHSMVCDKDKQHQTPVDGSVESVDSKSGADLLSEGNFSPDDNVRPGRYPQTQSPHGEATAQDVVLRPTPLPTADTQVPAPAKMIEAGSDKITTSSTVRIGSIKCHSISEGIHPDPTQKNRLGASSNSFSRMSAPPLNSSATYHTAVDGSYAETGDCFDSSPNETTRTKSAQPNYVSEMKNSVVAAVIDQSDGIQFSTKRPRTGVDAQELLSNPESNEVDQTPRNVFGPGQFPLTGASALNAPLPDESFWPSKALYNDATGGDCRISVRGQTSPLPDLIEESVGSSHSSLQSATNAIVLTKSQPASKIGEELAARSKARKSLSRASSAALTSSRVIPSLNFSCLDLFTKLNEALETRSSALVDEDSTPTESKTVRQFRRSLYARTRTDRYRSWFCDEETPAGESESSWIVKRRASAAAETFIEELDKLSIPSVNAFVDKVAEFLPTISTFLSDGSDRKLEPALRALRALEDITNDALDKRSTKTADQTTSRLLLTGAVSKDPHGLNVGDPNTSKDLPPLPSTFEAIGIKAANVAGQGNPTPLVSVENTKDYGHVKQKIRLPWVKQVVDIDTAFPHRSDTGRNQSDEKDRLKSSRTSRGARKARRHSAVGSRLSGLIDVVSSELADSDHVVADDHAVLPGDRYPTSGLNPPSVFNLEEVRSFFSDDSSHSGSGLSNTAVPAGGSFRKRLTGFKTKKPFLIRAQSSEAGQHSHVGGYGSYHTHHNNILINITARKPTDDSHHSEQLTTMTKAEVRARKLLNRLRNFLVRGGELLFRGLVSKEKHPNDFDEDRVVKVEI